MSSPAAFDTIVQRLTEQWSSTPLQYENESFVPPTDKSPWVQVEVRGGLYGAASIGAPDQRLMREEGVLMLHVMFPSNRGSRDARVLAWNITRLFVQQDIDGMVFTDASIGAGEPFAPVANYAAMTATIDWQLDHEE